MNIDRFLPWWQNFIHNTMNAMVDEENDNENNGSPQYDAREVRQQEHLPPKSPTQTNTEPNINNLATLRLDRLQDIISQCSNERHGQQGTCCPAQIHELMKMQSNIHQMSNTCEPNGTRLLMNTP
jgi:hypothetical protein